MTRITIGLDIAAPAFKSVRVTDAGDVQLRP